MSKPEKEESAPRRDINIDRIGDINELVKQYQKPLIDKIKSSMSSGDVVIADRFEGLLVTGESTTVDAEGFVKLWEEGKITRAQFVRGIIVSTSEAKKILAEKDLDRISTVKPTAPSLRVARRDGVQIEVVDAIKRLSLEMLDKPKVGQAA
jgi:hypothetical protein